MADAASLRRRAHGPATGGIIAAPPKTWDESKVKGYNPDWDESKVKRDEKGRFDHKDGRSSGTSKTGSRGTSKTEAARRALEAHAEKMKAQKKAWDEKVKNAKTVGARQVLMGNAMEKGWEVTQRKDGSVLIKTPYGPLELPPDDVYMQYPESRDAFIDYAISQNMTVERFEDGSGWIITPWGNRVEFPSNQFYKDRDALPKSRTAALTATATKDWTPDKRREAAERGWALPDGSYPIKDKRDWHKARQALGRAKNRKLVVKHLRRRAKALGIPDSELDGIHGDR